MSQYMRWAVAICMIPVLGCVAETASEDRNDVGEVFQAIGSECAAASATAMFVGGANYTSPQTYDTTNCYKAVVIDIDKYSADFLGNYGSGRPGGTYINWKDAVPVTQSACNDSWVRADLFHWLNNTWIYDYPKDSHGTWISGDLFTGCFLPETSFTSIDLQAGNTYRIAATARTSATSSAPTRIVSVISQKPVILR
jgi:hypothetical protein